MKYISYNNHSFKKTDYYQQLSKDQKEEFDILSEVFYFKTNNYVLEHLIDWNKLETDAMFRLNFLHKNMLSEQDFQTLLLIYQNGAKISDLAPFIKLIKKKVTPQIKSAEECFPKLEGQRIVGLYHPFKEVLSLFPSPMMKTCHAYCSYCFRWVAFNNPTVQFDNTYDDPNTPVAYLKSHPEVSEIVFTGADPLTVKASKIKEYIDPLIVIDTVKAVRFNTKSLAWWPYRFTTDKDAENVLALFEHIVAQGKELIFCAHFTHVKELQTDVVIEAIKRIQATGAIIKCQGPVVEGINDTVEDWVSLWGQQVALNLQPYFMFMELDHNTEASFRVPLAKAVHIFQTAEKQVKGLQQPFNGPMFMNDVHCVSIDGVVEVNNQKHFMLNCVESPYTESKGKIKLVPFDSDTRSAGDLVKMFTPEPSLKHADTK